MQEVPDGYHAMTKEQFLKKHADTHTEIKAGSLIAKHPEDKNVSPFKVLPGKNLIESRGKEKQAVALRNFFMDAIEVRNEEILDKEAMPFDKLINAAIKMMPQQVETKNEHTFTFADMVKSATLELKRQETIDAEHTASNTDGSDEEVQV